MKKFKKSVFILTSAMLICFNAAIASATEYNDKNLNDYNNLYSTTNKDKTNKDKTNTDKTNTDLFGTTNNDLYDTTNNDYNTTNDLYGTTSSNYNATTDIYGTTNSDSTTNEKENTQKKITVETIKYKNGSERKITTEDTITNGETTIPLNENEIVSRNKTEKTEPINQNEVK